MYMHKNQLYLNVYCGIIFMWGSMSEGSQFFPGSWERNSVGRKFGIILINIIQMLIKYVGYKCLGKGYPQKPRKLVGHEQYSSNRINADFMIWERNYYKGCKRISLWLIWKNMLTVDVIGNLPVWISCLV